MLVLRRSFGQSIVIGEKGEIVVKILRDEDGKVIIGINAPKTVLVDRLEVFEKRQNPSASKCLCTS